MGTSEEAKPVEEKVNRRTGREAMWRLIDRLGVPMAPSRAKPLSEENKAHRHRQSELDPRTNRLNRKWPAGAKTSMRMHTEERWTARKAAKP